MVSAYDVGHVGLRFGDGTPGGARVNHTTVKKNNDPLQS